MSLTVREFQEKAGVTLWRDGQPNVPFSLKTPKTWSTESPDAVMEPFRGADACEDRTSKNPITRAQAMERFEKAAGFRPEWALGAGVNACLASDITYVSGA